MCVLTHFSHARLFATPLTVSHQSPLSMGFSKQEYWNGLPCPSPGDFPDPGIEPMSFTSPALAGRFFPLVPPGKPCFTNKCYIFYSNSIVSVCIFSSTWFCQTVNICLSVEWMLILDILIFIFPIISEAEHSHMLSDIWIFSCGMPLEVISPFFNCMIAVFQMICSSIFIF